MPSAIARKRQPGQMQVNNRPAAPIVGWAVLLPVVSQYLIAGPADPGAILLKAGQDTEVALIYHGAAVALNVAGAGFLLVRRAALILSDGTRGNRYRQQRDCEKKLVHRVPSF